MSSNPSTQLGADLSDYFVVDAVARPIHQEPTYLDPNLPQDLFLAPLVSVTRPNSTMGSRLEPAPTSLGNTLAGGMSTSRSRQKLSDPDLPEIGAIIDKYRIEELVGVGGFAVVYRATHLLLHTPAAIKLLRPKVLKRRPELAPALCAEARFAARVSHPNVVRVIDVTHTPLITYIVSEFVDGGTLGEAINVSGRLPVAQVVRIGVDVSEGLAAGLQQGIIHRDIKPANILLTKGGQAKVADMGLAQMQRPEGHISVLETNGLVGTPGYMAPEQSLNATKVDFRADMYALGVTLFHALIGSPPFPTSDRVRTLELHRTAPPPRPSDLLRGTPPALEAVLLKLLAKQPQDRYGSWEALIAALKAVPVT